MSTFMPMPAGAPAVDIRRALAFIPYNTFNSTSTQPHMNKKWIVGMSLLAAASLGLRAADAGENYGKHCAKCHGADGKGQTKMGAKLDIKDLTDAKVQGAFTDEAAAKAVKEGIKEGDKVRMKPIEGLTDDEIKALVAHVRKFKK